MVESVKGSHFPAVFAVFLAVTHELSGSPRICAFVSLAHKVLVSGHKCDCKVSDNSFVYTIK